MSNEDAVLPRLVVVNRGSRCLFWAAVAACVLAASSSSALGRPLEHSANASSFQVISSRSDTVSGGDALVELVAPGSSHWSIRVGTRDVTDLFHPVSAAAGHFAALIEGLPIGKSTLELRVDGGRLRTLDLVNHPLTGPIFSGPHQEPFLCQTEANGLGAPLDADCSATTVVQYYYKSTEAPSLPPQEILAAVYGPPGTLPPGFKRYDTFSPRPADIARITTSDGRTLDYIVRREIGTINRAVYDIRFLHQPGQPLPTPWSGPTPGWNGRLIYSFGGGCSSGYRQGLLLGASVPLELLLAQGYAVATSTLNIFANGCNDRISAETLSMVKEHFIKRFGVPVHTIGVGTSGGAMQQHLIAQNYPGLLDGIIPMSSFPDVVTGAVSGADCVLLDRAFSLSSQRWADEQKTAVSGFASWRTCTDGWGLDILVEPKNCSGPIPREWIFDKWANPKGIRCDIYNNEINVFGRDPRTGRARRPLDNVGVQYGLLAFNAGRISSEQFVELNEHIGGYDEDGNMVSSRMQADPDTVSLAYSRGLILTGGGGLPQTPIIDLRYYRDELANSHELFRTFLTRERLIAAGGSGDNHVIFVRPGIEALSEFLSPLPQTGLWQRDAVSWMDRWLDAISVDGGSGSRSAKVARNKPADLKDSCWAIDGERIVEPATYEGRGKCNQIYRPYGDPRRAAGAPPADDILKCVLKPIEPMDYPATLTVAQIERLTAIFPQGVCDYARPGVGKAELVTWQSLDAP